MMIWTLTVTVTPAATAAIMSRKKTAPRMVTSVVFDAACWENRLITLDPAGKVATTMKMSAETISAQPER